MEKKITRNKSNRFLINHIKLFVLLMVFWLVLSEKFELKFIMLGLITAALGTIVSKDVLILSRSNQDGSSEGIHGLDFSIIKYIKYWSWLIVQIFIANFQIALVVLSPKLPINPQIVVFKQKMKNPLSHLSLGNSITLTPGTLTVDIDEDTYIIHALTNETAASLYFENNQGEVREKIAHLFDEELDKSAY